MISWFIARLRLTDTDLREVIHGSAVAFAIKILAAGAAFAMIVTISRMLGASEAGLFFLALTVVTICSSITRLGLDQTFVRFISAHREENDWPFINGLYRTGMTWSLLTSLILAIFLWACAGLIAEHIFKKPEFASVFSIMVWGIPLVTLLTLHA